MSSEGNELTELKNIEASIEPSSVDDHFFEAVRKGETQTVQRYIDEDLVDVNGIDVNGQTALQIAVAEEHIAIVHLLVNQGAQIGNALIDAINSNSLESVAVLAPLHGKSSKQLLRTSSKVERSVEVVLPPLVLAAQNDNYEIVKFLLKEGEKIESPHSKYCDCEGCEDLGRLGTYLLHLNTYRALVSPEFISLEFLLQDDKNEPSIHKDPLYRAFVLKREILHRAETEYEFRDDYYHLAEKSEDFAVGLLNQCRNLEEISTIMSLPGITDLSVGPTKETATDEKKPNLSILNFALKNKNNKFIAHRFSQVMLNSVFYTGVKGMEENNHFLSTFLVFLYWIAMPTFMLIYQLTPTNQWSRMLEIPIVKFLSHVGSWIWFLVILTVAAFETKIPKRSERDVQVIETMIGIWVAGLILEEAKQFYRLGKNTYFSQWWRVVAALVCICFFMTGILWVTDFGILSQEKGTVLQLNATSLNNFEGNVLRQTIRMSGHTFYTLGVLLTFCQVSHNLQVSYYLGPLHITFMDMASDVLKFIFIFGLAYLAFAIGLKELYSWYESTAKAESGNGVIATHAFVSLDGSFRYLFWSLFQDIDTDVFKTERRFDKYGIIQYTGEIMIALYCVVAIVVALNLLIAMLTNTFNKVGGDRYTRFKVNRTRILMQYVNQGSVTPSPMNLIPFRYLLSCIYNKCKNCIGVKPIYTPQLRMRNKVMRAILHRYLEHRKKQTQKTEPSDASPNEAHSSAL